MLTKKRKAWAATKSAAPTFRGSPLQHNAAVAVRYAGALSALTAQMTAQVKREVLRLFETDAAGAHFGQDATIASQSRILVNSLANRFSDLFNKKAKPLAENMVAKASKSGAAALHASLQKLSGGMSLKTSLSSPALENITKAAVAENVGLIKSIATKYIQQVEGAVMRSITTGNGLQDLIPALEQYEGQTHRRARNIALDQTRKVYNSVNKGRMQALGVKKFMWHHSGGGAHPREDHIDMDGEIYSFDDLPVIDQRTGEKGIPGQAPNCLVGDTLVDLSNGCDYVWRYFYEGDLFTLEFDGGSIGATPNHPFLTQRGWVKAKDLQLSDYLIQAHGQGVFGIENDVADRKVTIEEVFFSVRPVFRNTRPAAQFDFHGDIPNHPVDEVRPDLNLPLGADTCLRQSVEKEVFSRPDSNGVKGLHVLSTNGAAGAGHFHPTFGAKALHPDGVGLPPSPRAESIFLENPSNDASGEAEHCRDRLDALAFSESVEDGGVNGGVGGGLSTRAGSFYAASAERLAEIVRADFQGSADADQSFTACYSLLRVKAKRVRKFSGHVHTMQTSNGWFKSTSAGIITKNCRCTMSPVFDFEKED